MHRKIKEATDHVTCRHCRTQFRAITFWHLHNIHGYTDDHPIEEYKRRFRIPFALCRDSRDIIRDEKEAYWAKKGQHWTHSRVLSGIRQFHKGNNSKLRRKIPTRLALAARRYFGSFEAAVHKAGLDYEEVIGVRRWTPAILIQRICALADAGVPLAAKYIKKRHYYLYRAAVKRFPSSWAKAIRAAGFDPNEHKTQRGRWNRAKAEAWVKKHAKDGRSVLAQRAPKDLVSYVHQHVKGGWVAFIESLGFTYPGVKRRRDWTAPKLLAEMRKWKRAGCSTNYRAVSAISQALIHQARKFFGSWKHARAAAGV